MLTAVAGAQVFPVFPSGSSAPNASTGVRVEGAYTSAPIVLDGAVLFRIAALTSAPADQLPLTLRQSYVENALAQIVATEGTSTAYDPKTFRIQTKMQGSQALLQIVDAKQRTPFPILTVTSVDAKYHQQAVDDLAAQWQKVLQIAIARSLKIRQPAVQRHSATDVLRLAIALVLLSILVWLVAIAIRRRIATLQALALARGRAVQDEQAQSTPTPEEAHQRRRRFLALALRATTPAQRLGLYRAVEGVLMWGLLLIWFGAVTWALAQFPQTTPISHALARGAIGVLAIWIVTGLLNRILDIAIARSAWVWQRHATGNAEERARQLLRVPTITRALAGFKTFVLIFLAALATLSQLGISIGSVLTIGGVAAIAVTLAAQNFVRDFVGGFLVLFEDQYVVGDYVSIKDHSGLVEHLTLRMVQIRDGGGNLVTIPHSTVADVMNHSRYWSRIDYRISVDPAADIPQAIALVQEAIEQLAREAAWHDVVLDPVEWIGVAALSRDFVAIRASIKTAPLRQFELRREVNARVQQAFAKAGIGFGAPLPDNAT